MTTKLGEPNPNKPFPGDCYSYKDGILVVASLHLIKSLPL